VSLNAILFMPSFVKICTTAQYFKWGDDAETGWRAHVPNYYFLRREAGGYWLVSLTASVV
jgi:hypothetical protein